MTETIIALAVMGLAFFTAGFAYGQVFRAGPTDVPADQMTYVRRAQAILLRFEEVKERGDRAAQREDLEGMQAALHEADLLTANLREIRLEQLQALTGDKG